VKVVVFNPIEDPSWDSLLERCDQSTFFHTSAWARVLSESYAYSPLYFAVIDDGRLRGLIPVMEIRSLLTGKRGVSLPFTDMCHPVAKDQETFNLLLQELLLHARLSGWKHVEIRGGREFLLDEPFSAEHFVHTLELHAYDAAVSKNFKPNIRRNIRKAEKAGVSVTFEHSLEAVAAYYRLHCGTRRHHGLPPQPWSFFRKFYEHVIATGKGFVALAKYQHHWIAGAVYVFYRDQAIYKYGASDRGAQHLRPNNLVMWEAIQWCCRNGFRTFSFGRTEPENSGLLQFKRGWGTHEEKLAYYEYSVKDNGFVKPHSMLKPLSQVFKFMPEPLARLAGNCIYRHVG